jgi:hypothetical protein
MVKTEEPGGLKLFGENCTLPFGKIKSQLFLAVNWSELAREWHEFA